MSISGLPEFEAVDHPDPGYEGFSLIRPRVIPDGYCYQEFADDIREEICTRCNKSGNVHTCMGMLYSKNEGISARISKERNQSENCPLLINRLEGFEPKHPIRITRARII